jgi:hypothetical protein
MRNSFRAGLLGEQIHIEAAVAVVDEDFLAVVPPLRDVVRRAHRHHASTAWHGFQLGTGGQPLSKLRLSHFPIFLPRQRVERACTPSIAMANGCPLLCLSRRVSSTSDGLLNPLKIAGNIEGWRDKILCQTAQHPNNNLHNMLRSETFI